MILLTCPAHGTDNLVVIEISTVTEEYTFLGAIDSQVRFAGGHEVCSEPVDRFLACKAEDCGWTHTIINHEFAYEGDRHE